ncbi:MAG TPA: hypothetical protein VMG31_01310 [Verrucomicrobiae bacterium]|nr:hypothetical protein [Verrucomicrobiae bacterium]
MGARTMAGAAVLMLTLMLAAGGAWVSATAQSADVAVIVNPANSVSNISLADLRKIFAGSKRSWSGGVPVRLVVRAPGCRERLSLLRLLGMSETEYKQYWTAQVFRGDADSEPVALPSFGMVKEAVVAFPGAISLADAGSIRTGMYVKVLKIDGHLPGDPGYPLR